MRNALTLVSLITAGASLHCGGQPEAAVDTTVQLARSGGGGTTTPPPANPLPTTAPAPGVLYRESFGLADLFRPQGGKGVMREVALHTTIGGFWLEYPGSKNTQWLTPNGDQTWKFAGCSDDPYEMPSPIQVTYGNGCVVSEWFDPVSISPTALMPITTPTGAYELSMDGYPSVVPGAYVAIGFTSSGALISNLETAGSVWLLLRAQPLDSLSPLTYELRVDGRNGPVLATGTNGYLGWNKMALRYDPAAQQVTAVLNDTPLGSFPLSMSAPRYAAFEGVGVLDNFVVRE